MEDIVFPEILIPLPAVSVSILAASRAVKFVVSVYEASAFVNEVFVTYGVSERLICVFICDVVEYELKVVVNT